MTAVGVINKALSNGQVRMYLADEWALVKYQLVKLPNEWVDTDAWDRARVWEALKHGALVVDGQFIWQYFEMDGDTFDGDGHGQPLFTEGPVVFLSEMLAALDR